MEKCYTSIYRSDTLRPFASAHIDPYTADDRLDKHISQLFDRLSEVPSDFFDVWTIHENYIRALDYYEIAQCENHGIIKEFERSTSAKLWSDRNKKLMLLDTRAKEYRDFMICYIQSKIKDEIRICMETLKLIYQLGLTLQNRPTKSQTDSQGAQNQKDNI